MLQSRWRSSDDCVWWFIRSMFYNALDWSVPSVPGRTRRFGIQVRLRSPARGCTEARPDCESVHGSQPPAWSRLWRQEHIRMFSWSLILSSRHGCLAPELQDLI